MPGILINRLRRPALLCKGLSLGHRGLGVVGKERRDFQRHPPIHGGRAFVDRREQSAARVKSCTASSKNNSSPERRVPTSRRISESYDSAVGDGVIEDHVGFDVRPVTERSSM